MQSQETNRPAEVAMQRSAVWEGLGFLAVLVALVVYVLLGDREWAVLLMLFAIYCAAMR